MANLGGITHFIVGAIEILSRLKDWVPFFQSLVWPLFLAGLLFIYRRQIAEIVEECVKRVRLGKRIKMGPFELDEIAPQTQEDQKQKIEFEMKRSSPAAEAFRQPFLDYFRIEDLLMRNLQSKHRVLIQRQVSVGKLKFDGLLMSSEMIAVEAAYIRNSSNLNEFVEKINNRIIEIKSEISSLKMNRFTLWVYFITDKDAISNSEQARISDIISSATYNGMKFEAKFATVSELEQFLVS